MNTLVTGATGLVGNAVAKLLVERGHRVRALVRDVARARPLLPESVELVPGDVEDPASIERAVVDAGKAMRELGFTPTPLEEGIRKTIAFLREQGLVPKLP